VGSALATFGIEVAEVVAGDVLDTGSVQAELKGCDAIVGTNGLCRGCLAGSVLVAAGGSALLGTDRW
jgi:hypothetical protein